MLYIIQLIIYCATFSLICVAARANNPINILYFYPKDMQEKAFELGLTNKKSMKIKMSIMLSILFLVMIAELFIIIKFWNNVSRFKPAFYQAMFFLQLWNIYDGIVMDKLWPEKSDFWIIPELKDIYIVPSWSEIIKKRLIFIPFLFLFALIMAKLVVLL